MMGREKKLFKNMIVFALGNMGGKALQFLLLPFYTYVLNRSEYGQIDVLQSVASLIGPLISLSIVEGVFRYTIELQEEKDEVLSVGVLIISIGLLISLFFASLLGSYISYLTLMVFYIASNLFFNLFSQFVKAMEKNHMFAAINLFQVFLICLFSILALRVYHLGIYGYFYAYIAGNTICTFILFCKEKLWRWIRFNKRILSQPIARRMLKFSIPLIPNATCWWLINFLDRIMITAFYGSSANGIYTVAHKLPTIITVIMNIFFSAWQISANQEFGSKDSSHFFGHVYELLRAGLIGLAAILIPFSKLFCKVLLSPAYYEAWEYIPIMLLGIVFFSFAQFLGSIYSASMRTTMAFVTNFLTAILNGVLNYFLLLKIGTYGAALATTLCYIFLWLIRAWNTQSLLHMTVSWRKFGINMFCLILEVIAMTLSKSFLPLIAVILMMFILFLNRKLFTENFVQIKMNFMKGKSDD